MRRALALTSHARLSYASANARRLGFETRAKLVQGNWAKGLLEKFDLILCNPPYIADGAELGPGVREYEPDEALFAGSEGLDAYRELAPQLPRLLSGSGLAAIEIGPDQAKAVNGLLERDGLEAKVAQDLAGQGPRIVANLGLRENCLAYGVRRTTSGFWPGPAPLR